MNLLCPLDNVFVGNVRYCEGTTQKKANYSCRTVPCRSNKPKHVNTRMSRREFGNGYERLVEAKASAYIQDIYASYREQGRAKTFNEFLNIKEEFQICRRHINTLPYRFMRELETMREVRAVVVATPKVKREDLSELNNLLNELPSVAQTVLLTERERILRETKEGPDLSELVEKVKKFLQGDVPHFDDGED